MKYATEMDSCGMIYIPSFMTTVCSIHVILTMINPTFTFRDNYSSYDMSRGEEVFCLSVTKKTNTLKHT